MDRPPPGSVGLPPPGLQEQGSEHPREALVGRERELAELSAGLRRAGAGRGQIFMLVGEPGIGKTRLASEVADRAQRKGALALWGRLWDGGGAPPYWPWIQIVRAYASTHGDAELAAALGPSAPYVAQLVPELRERLPDFVEPAPSLEPQTARFYLFDAIAQFLGRAASARPLLLVLDDLHAADLPSALLLQLVLRQMLDRRIMVLGTYREAEIGRQPRLAAVLGQLASEAHHLPLRGLSESEVRLLARENFGVVPPRSVVAAIYWATDGNPFLVDEVLHLLVAEGRLGSVPSRACDVVGIPQGVREALRSRMAQLGVGARAILSAAAVIGREFDLAHLERMCHEPLETVGEALAQAASLAMVRETSGVAGRYTFCHALIREALYDDIVPATRLRLHRRAGEGIESLHGASLDAHLPALAHHFLIAAPEGDRDKGIRYSRRAAVQACSQLAYEEAVAHIERALQALPLAGGDEHERCELLLALGTACDAAGDLTRARQVLQEAAEVARRLGVPAALARAALGFGGHWTAKFTATVFEVSHTPLLEEALAALGRGDDPLCARLLSRLAMSAAFAGAHERGVSLSREALDMARRLGDETTLPQTLSARHAVLLGPDHADERLTIARELAACAARCGDRELALRAHALRSLDLLELGDAEGSALSLALHAELAAETSDPFDLWLSAVCRSARALFDGRLIDAEQLVNEAVTIAYAVPGQQATEANAGSVCGVQLTALARERGWQRQVEPLVTSFAERYPHVWHWRVLLSSLHVDLGRREAARRELAQLARHGFADLPRDVCWLAMLCLLAEVSAFVGDRAAAQALDTLLRPFAERFASIPCCAHFGSVARYLGILASAMGERDRARAHFAAALAAHERTGSRTWLAHTQLDLATMLLGQPGGGAEADGRALLAPSVASARELGLATLLARAEALAARADDAGRRSAAPPDAASSARSPSPGAGHPPADPPSAETERRAVESRRRPARGEAPLEADGDEQVFCKDGDYWMARYDRTVVLLRELKGFRYLAVLLRRPGTHLHALAVVHAVEGLPVADAGATTAQSQTEQRPRAVISEGDPVIDPQAEGDYRSRLRALRAELDAAEEGRQHARAAELREEIGFLARELQRALGLGGRVRRIGSTAERARVNVTRAIKSAIARIAEHHAGLGRHLARTIHTGTFCVYAPDPRLPIEWRTEPSSRTPDVGR